MTHPRAGYERAVLTAREETVPANRIKPIEVRPAKGGHSGWEVARQGSATAISTHRTQQAAIKKGKPIAKRERTEFILKGRSGRVRDRSSFGSDPTGRG
jgi:Uncharacterized protein conserved in bacteria (DUF2188)